MNGQAEVRPGAGGAVPNTNTNPDMDPGADPDADADTKPAEPPTSYVLLHGWKNRRPAGHWHHWLARQLRAAGHRVEYPQLPDPDEPKPGQWVDAVAEALHAVAGTRPVVICHSLACLAWLHLRTDPELAQAVTADRLALVAPPSPSIVRGIDEIKLFAPPPQQTGLPGEFWDGVRIGARDARLFYSENDHYCPGGAERYYGRPLGIRSELIPGQAHLDMDAGYGDWPAMLAWCLDEDAPIGPR